MRRCDGSACHLGSMGHQANVVFLPETKAKRCLLNADAQFPKEQLGHENFELLLLVNGNGVMPNHLRRRS